MHIFLIPSESNKTEWGPCLKGLLVGSKGAVLCASYLQPTHLKSCPESQARQRKSKMPHDVQMQKNKFTSGPTCAISKWP